MQHDKRNGRGLHRLIRAGKSSLAGFTAAFKHEEAFRQELLLVVVLFPVALLLGETGVERALLAGSLLLVMIVELLNSAVEAVVDRVGLDYHLLSGRAKDMGSAAVFLVIVHAIMVWLVILLPF
ncbi:MAG: diacylglycerol kinase [Proteobacteria bacterium]|nr:diacylglycerol kinase [Pseudomonadota bacterium]MBU4294267.1 diacylglycerol kinase [Pseudomonadota bacterium]